MGKITVGAIGIWAALAAISFLLVADPPTSAAVAVPEAQPEPCCGRFAAGALGFAGGFLVGRHRHRHHGGGCGGCGGGCGGCGGGCGWCGGGHYGRKRRSLDEVMQNDSLENVYWKIAQQDKDQCGLRLVCELAQKDPNTLAEEEIVILLPYRGRARRDITSNYELYDQAAWHGQEGHLCNEIYPLCIFDSPQMMADFAANGTLFQV